MVITINQPSDKLKVRQYIDKLPDRKYKVEIKVVREQRSIPANRLYWLWLNCIMSETGNHRDDLHEELTRMYLPKVTTIYRDREIEKPISTTKLDKKQFSDYMNRVQQFAASEFGCVLPNPEDLHFEEFKSHFEDYI